MKNIQRIRKQRGMTQKELASRSGVDIRKLQNYEQGVRDINGASVLTVYKLARALGVNTEELIEFD